MPTAASAMFDVACGFHTGMRTEPTQNKHVSSLIAFGCMAPESERLGHELQHETLKESYELANMARGAHSVSA